MMLRKHVSGEEIKREWLMYSPSTGNVYCFSRILFSATSACQTQFLEVFSDWNNAAQGIKVPEDSSKYRQIVQTLIYRRRTHKRIDISLESQFNKEQEYWIKVLQRAVSVIKFLSSRGKHIGSQHSDNYLGILELIEKYDPFLSSHIAR
ncbi:zinc finger MYM-type protein 1 [Trichonephila clavipes]|nr:zinc finger MYM-type protein 1 [Trichonephila clavipes]